jgi:hypothetical protein
MMPGKMYACAFPFGYSGSHQAVPGNRIAIHPAKQ